MQKNGFPVCLGRKLDNNNMRQPLKYLVATIILFSSYTGCRETDPVVAEQGGFFKVIETNDLQLDAPREGEWRFDHNEHQQTFEQYKNSHPVRPSGKQQLIYIEPYGTFSAGEQKVLSSMIEYLSIFYQLPVRLLPPANDNIIPITARRIRNDGAEQLLATYFIDTLLKKNKPTDAAVVIAVTTKDLYPKPSWNFIFGLASYRERIAVCSIKRLYKNLNNTADLKHCLSRLINISSHETGHMFGLHHCVTASCVMNGSNSLAETDLQPNRLCARCVKKLYWNCRFNNRTRLKALQDFFYNHRLARGYMMAKQDYDKTSTSK
jgi:archaemetzincin